jgi:RNA polymerase sigma-70 factor (ECF subfamily)
MVQDAGVRVSTEGLETVYREHGPAIWRALVAFAGNKDAASDALAEAFAQALARGDAIRDPVAWIWRVAFIVARAELKERSEGAPMNDEPSYELPDPLVDLFRVLDRLSPNQRLAIVLHDYADRPTDEVAAVMGASRATVHVHLSKGRRRLRDLLETNDA